MPPLLGAFQIVVKYIFCTLLKKLCIGVYDKIPFLTELSRVQTWRATSVRRLMSHCRWVALPAGQTG
jgi:hypothetical protein